MAWASFTARVTRSGMPVLHSLARKTPVRRLCSQKEGLRDDGGLVWGGCSICLENLTCCAPFLPLRMKLALRADRLICVMGALEQEPCSRPRSGLVLPLASNG